MELDPAFFQENERLTSASDERKIAAIGAMSVKAGGKLDEVQIAYETWGTLNADRSNAVLVCHALSGDSHAIGWWDRLIGPGKPIDTEQFFVIGTNALGGCQGSTGPSSLAADGKPYGSRFPAIRVEDMVTAQARLMDQLGIEKLLMVCGGSMGGMQALEWAVQFPHRVKKAWLTASCRAHSAMQIGFNEAARQAIMRDPKWLGGDYPLDDGPNGGLAVARMIGHLSFLSEESFARKFGRGLQNSESLRYVLTPEFQVESYLNYQGDKFTHRFDANSLLCLTKAIDWYECRSLESAKADFLITSFNSDWLYPSHQSSELHQMAQDAGLKSKWVDFDIPFGHDCFLLDGEHQGTELRNFLSKD